MAKRMLLLGRIGLAYLGYFVGYSAVFTGIWELVFGEFSIISWLTFLATVTLYVSPLIISVTFAVYFKIKRRWVETGKQWDSFFQMKKPDQDREIKALGINTFHPGRSA